MINPATALLMVRHVLAVPRGEWLLQSAASGELGRMIIRLAKHDGIKTINVVRRRDAAQELTDLGADAVIVSGDGPIDEQVHNVVGPQGVSYDFGINGVLSIMLDKSGYGYAAWNGGIDGANGKGDFAKNYRCDGTGNFSGDGRQ